MDSGISTGAAAWDRCSGADCTKKPLAQQVMISRKQGKRLWRISLTPGGEPGAPPGLVASRRATPWVVGLPWQEMPGTRADDRKVWWPWLLARATSGRTTGPLQPPRHTMFPGPMAPHRLGNPAGLRRQGRQSKAPGRLPRGGTLPTRCPQAQALLWGPCVGVAPSASPPAAPQLSAQRASTSLARSW
jgi:hypothetical protein